MTNASPPPHEPNHIEWVGIIANSWALLEFDINSTIHVLAGIEHDAGACLTANIGSIHLRLQSLQALVEFRGGSAKLLASIRGFAGALGETATKRNRAVHDPWMPGVHITTDGKPAVDLGQFVAKAD